MNDVALMEASLAAVAGREAGLRAALFDRFLAAYPERRALFLHQATTSIRMTDETLQWLLGLAGGANWVWGQVAELVFQHRNYGHLTRDEYAAFVTMAIAALRDAAVPVWDDATDAAWRRAGDALDAMIARAIDEWTAAPLSYP